MKKLIRENSGKYVNQTCNLYFRPKRKTAISPPIFQGHLTTNLLKNVLLYPSYFLHRTSKWAWQKGLKSTLQWGRGVGGGIHLTFLSFLTVQPILQMLENIINSKTNPSAATHFPASSAEQLLFCQPERFLWGTDKVRNRFVGCP